MRHAHIESYVWDLAEKVQDMATHYVLLAIAEKCDWKTGETFVSAKTLSEMCFCDEKTIRTHVKKLIDLKVIEVADAPQGKSRTLRVVGYAEHRSNKTPVKFTGPVNGQDTPVNSSGPVRENLPDHPGKNARLSQSHISQVNLSHSPLTPLTEERASSLDAWEASPPSPFTPSEGKWVSNQTENPSSPVVNRQTGPTGNIRIVTNAGDAARQVTGASVSTAGWVKVWRVNDEKNFNDWCEWMEANGYMQVVSARTRGFAFVPTPELVDGIEAFKRKFPLAKSAVLSNDALSAKETVG
jgi:hypothetical protein